VFQDGSNEADGWPSDRSARREATSRPDPHTDTGHCEQSLGAEAERTEALRPRPKARPALPG